MVIEAVYLTDLLPIAMMPALLVNGMFTAALFSIAVVWLYPRISLKESVVDFKIAQLYSIRGSILRLVLTSLLWIKYCFEGDDFNVTNQAENTRERSFT